MRDDLRLQQFYRRESGTFSDWFDVVIRPMLAAWDRIHRKRLLRLARGLDGLNFSADWTAVAGESPDVRRLIESSMTGRNASDAQIVYQVSRVVGEGLKVFRPTAPQCEAMEQIEPRFPTTDYRQPFPTIVIELPADYSDNRMVHGDSPISQETREVPIGIIATHEETMGCLMIAVILRAEVHMLLQVALDEDRLMSEVVFVYGHRARYGDRDNDCQANPAEQDLLRKATLIAVNACSLLVTYGCRRLPENDRKRKNRLTADLRTAQRNRRDVEAAEAYLRCHPVVYGFEQEVVLYEEAIEEEAAQPGAAGWHQGPHWRPGCWVQQPHGPRSSLRKRIFRRAVLVHPHLLRGPLSATTVNIRTDWREGRGTG